MPVKAYDMLAHTLTRAGIPGPKALQALRHYVVAGDVDRACDVAFDMYRTSEDWEGRIWDELMQIALREVGLADPYAVEQVHSLRKIKETTEIYNLAGGGMHCLCFVQAIRYLCACGRDDSLEAVAKEICSALDGGAQPVIPDFCYDHHTRLGVEWGRTPLDFLDPDGGSKVVPALEGVAEPYIARLREILTPEYGHGEKYKAPGYIAWEHFNARSGVSADLILAAFQKCIRRAMEHEALMVACDGFLSGRDFEEYFFKRMVIMSIEDIGMGDPNCHRLMAAYRDSRTYFPDDPDTRLMYLLQGVRYLCSCKKERATELIKGIMVKEFAAGKVPEMPE